MKIGENEGESNPLPNDMSSGQDFPPSSLEVCVCVGVCLLRMEGDVQGILGKQIGLSK